jgi:transposase InsO family protein
MPQPVTFEPGVCYVLQEESYQVIQLLDDGMLVARHLTTNTHITHRLTELWQHWQEHTLEFAREGANLRENTGTLLKTTYAFADLADLPPNLQEITWHRYQLIRPLLHLSPHQRSRQRVKEQIQTYLSLLEKERAQGKHPFLFGLRVGRGTGSKQQFSPSASVPSEPNQSEQAFLPAPMASQESCLQNDDSAVESPDKQDQETSSRSLHPLLDLTPRTVSRWIRRYVESHEDIRSLVPSYHQRGPRHSQMHPRLETLLQQAIKQTYLTNVRAPVTHVITSFQALIIAENTQRSPEEQLPTPGNMTIYRSLQQLDAQDVDRARKGAAQAERDHHQSQQGPLPTRPNQRTEFDFAQLDLLVVDAIDHLPIGRPTLAAIRDKYTGYPLGVFISFDPPSYRLVMECMLYAFLPKPHVKALFQTQHEYLAFGIPELLAVDNAIELERDLELACLQLGIELQHLPVRKPWFKGSIERWFRTLNTNLIHVTPDTSHPLTDSSQFDPRAALPPEQYMALMRAMCISLHGLQPFDFQTFFPPSVPTFLARSNMINRTHPDRVPPLQAAAVHWIFTAWPDHFFTFLAALEQWRPLAKKKHAFHNFPDHFLLGQRAKEAYRLLSPAYKQYRALPYEQQRQGLFTPPPQPPVPPRRSRFSYALALSHKSDTPSPAPVTSLEANTLSQPQAAPITSDRPLPALMASLKATSSSQPQDAPITSDTPSQVIPRQTNASLPPIASLQAEAEMALSFF